MERSAKSDAEFFANATAVVNSLEKELRRVPSKGREAWRALEIGCGSGRLLRPLCRHFLELHGVEVSEELLRQARERAHDLSRVHVHLSTDGSFPVFADASLDFVYSYDFFPHIFQHDFPRSDSRGMILEFLREMQRVLRPGGLARLEFSGGQFTSHELLELAQMHACQVLALEGAGTPSLWTTWRKLPGGAPNPGGASRSVVIRRMTNASSLEPVAPCRGRFASIVLRVENLPPDTGIQHLRVTIGSSQGSVTYIGPVERNGWQAVHVDLPELEATGLLPVQVWWLDRPLSEPATLRVIPPGPLVPRVVSGPTHGESRTVSVTLEEVARPWEIEVSLGGRPVEDIELICTDPRPQRYAVKFRIPEDLAAGSSEVRIQAGRRKLPPITVDVTQARNQ